MRGAITIEEAKQRSPNVHKLARALRRRGYVIDPSRTISRIKSNEEQLQQHLSFIQSAPNREVLSKRVSQVAQEIGVKEHTVYNMLHRMGFDIVQDTLRERDKKVFELTREGLSYAQIARQLGISITTVKDTFVRYGVSRFLVIRDGSPI